MGRTALHAISVVRNGPKIIFGHGISSACFELLRTLGGSALSAQASGLRSRGRPCSRPLFDDVGRAVIDGLVDRARYYTDLD